MMLHATPFVHTTLVGAVYVPAGHPVPATVNWADTLLEMVTAVGVAEKFAVIVEGEFSANVSGLAALMTLPLHPVNFYPDAGVAVNWICVPSV